MKKVTSLEAFKKVENREAWEKWVLEYKESNKAKLNGNFFMDRYSVYDFSRFPESHACLQQLIAYEEYGEYYVLKNEYC